MTKNLTYTVERMHKEIREHGTILGHPVPTRSLALDFSSAGSKRWITSDIQYTDDPFDDSSWVIIKNPEVH